MTQDDLKSAIDAKRAELAALETEAKTLPFTTDDQNKIGFAYDAIMYLYSELRGERHPEQIANDHRVRFKLIEALDKRLAAVEATTRMIGEEVFADDLADDVAPDAASSTRRMLDGWVVGLSPLSSRELTAKIEEQAATIAKLEADLEREQNLRLEQSATITNDKIEQAAAISDRYASVAINELALESAHQTIKDQAETIANLKADLEAAIIVPEGYEAKPQYSIFSDVLDAIFFEKKIGAK